MEEKTKSEGGGVGGGGTAEEEANLRVSRYVCFEHRKLLFYDDLSTKRRRNSKSGGRRCQDVVVQGSTTLPLHSCWTLGPGAKDLAWAR